MKILIYGLNYSPELVGIGKYTGEMAAWLANFRGHEVRVITAPPYYPGWIIRKNFSNTRYKFLLEDGVRVMRCPLFVPRQPTAIKRLAHLLSFSLSSLLPVLLQWRWKPDLVIHIAPTLFCAPQALVVAKLSRCRSLVHVQDFEVDAMFGLSMAANKRFRALALAVERWLFDRYDWISTISEGMVKRAKAKGIDQFKLMLFPNWSEIDRFVDVRRDQKLLSSLGVDPKKKIVLYSGNLGEKQGLEDVVSAAKILENNDAIQFLIVGDGAAKSRLLAQVAMLKLSNVIFADLQPYEYLPALLASADCHLVVQRRGAADSVLPSKLTNIFAIGGTAVITADGATTLGILCVENPGIAVLVEPESATGIVDGIMRVLAMPPHNVIATDYAKFYLDKEVMLRRFIQAFE